MTHQIASSVVLVALALIAAWTLLRLRCREADRFTRALGVAGACLFVALAANESYRLVELANTQPATAAMEVPTCAK